MIGRQADQDITEDKAPPDNTYNSHLCSSLTRIREQGYISQIKANFSPPISTMVQQTMFKILPNRLWAVHVFPLLLLKGAFPFCLAAAFFATIGR